MKQAFSYLVAAVVLAGVAWTGMYFFWHIRIVGAVRTLESKAGTPAADDAADVIDSAGCRALPYLLGALDHRKNPYFLIIVSKALVSSIEKLASNGVLPDPAVAEKAREWIILQEDAAPQLQSKCDALLNYWRDHGELHHKSWRVWTSSCGVP
jgi:hypothetical protein